MLLFLTFVLGPFIVAIGLSLFRWDMLTEPEFIGLDNLAALATDTSCYNAPPNTFAFSLAAICTHLAARFPLCIEVHKLRSKFVSYVAPTPLFFPLARFWSAFALRWKSLLDPTFAMVTYYKS